jgi:hypothetical protein
MTVQNLVSNLNQIIFESPNHHLMSYVVVVVVVAVDNYIIE